MEYGTLTGRMLMETLRITGQDRRVTVTLVNAALNETALMWVLRVIATAFHLARRWTVVII